MDPASPLQPYTPAPLPPQADQPMQPQRGTSTPVNPMPPLPSINPAQSSMQSPMMPQQSFSSTTNAQYTPQLPPINNNFAPMPPAMPPLAASPKNDVVEQLKKANNVLVTVSNNPSVDQLSAAIGLTLALNKLEKHATAVYSGVTPSTIEFLQPEKTIEKNTDSLRDFIISLDKAKADKLRYKVEDKFVKIFITPYHTSLSESDLEFSQGDFNVDVIIAIGVHQREELDQTITSHGRILHDAVTVSINNKQSAELGAVNWYDAEASSLCEMIVGLLEPIQGDKVILDNQIATSFLTGIVAETQRFSNTKTTAHTMNVSATLMKAGANQQLVASKLEAPKPAPVTEKTFDTKKMDELAKGGTSPVGAVPTPRNDGSLSIPHTEEKGKSKTLEEIAAENNSYSNDPDQPESDLAKIHIDNEGRLLTAEQEKEAKEKAEAKAPESKMALTPPIISGNMNSTDISQQPVPEAPSAEQATAAGLVHGKTINPLSSDQKPAATSGTLSQLEEKVNSPHLQSSATNPSAEEVARQAVNQATHTATNDTLEPVAALNAMPIELNKDQPAPAQNSPLTTEQVFPTQLVKPDTGLVPDPNAGAVNPSAPPLVPPPLMPPSS
jgi:nanoRNase/pAp phosphatase (c-di-AMP/oligoRNAs hydrolase)